MIDHARSRSGAADPGDSAGSSEASAPNDSAATSSPDASADAQPSSGANWLPKLSFSLPGIMKFIYYGILLALGIFVLWRYGDQLREFWLRVMHDLGTFWGRLFPGAEREGTMQQGASSAPPPPAFNTFTNPFQAGRGTAPEADLLRYSFSALEAWGRDQGLARGAEETPLEFAARLAQQFPQAGAPIGDVCLLYSQLAYGGGNLPSETRQRLRRFWSTLQASAADSAPAPV